MPELRSIAEKVRSKNAGPFWVTIDIFCGSREAFERVRDGLSTEVVASRFDTPVQLLKRFDIKDLNVVKISVRARACKARLPTVTCTARLGRPWSPK